MTFLRPSVGSLVAVTVLAVACAASPPPALPAAAGVIAPTPYTARQIHDTCKPGHTLVFRIEAPGKPTTLRTIRFVSVTDDTAELEESTADEQGNLLEPRTRQTAR